MGGKSTGRSTSMPSSPKTASSQGRSTRKRALSAISRDSGGKRRAKGGAAQPSTPFKTPAAKSQKLSEEPSSAGSGVSSATSSDNESGSEYGQEERRSDPKTSNSSSSSSSGGSQAGEPSSSDEAVKPKSDGQRRGATKSTAATARANAQGDSIWRAGVKTGLGPGTEVYIKKPKARDAGTTAYTDETVHPNTMLFLRDLARNNDREWLKAHDPDYRASLKDFQSYIEALTERIISADDTVPELPMKDVIFRIYRDIRFSSDPTPYKAYFSAGWSRTGRKGPYAGYYFQLMPGGRSLVAGGLWLPEAAHLARIRDAINDRPEEMKRVWREPRFRRMFLNGADGDKTMVKAFTAHNSESALKTKPKGYDIDHAEIELLRLRSFTASRKLSDSDVERADGLTTVAETIDALVPWITYLNRVILPDED